METVYVYPGSFCPPTFGHLHILAKAAEIFPEVVVVCSVDPEKENRWFTPEECKAMWQTYKLPTNTIVETFDRFKDKVPDMSCIVMVRGIRNRDDAEHEKEIMLYNKSRFGIEKYFYVFCDNGFEEISSSDARKTAEDLNFKSLSKHVSPLVISILLEKVLGIENLFMVTGKPGSGKSTWLKMLTQKDPKNVWVNTDEFNHAFKPLLRNIFGNEDLVQVALSRKTDLKKVIAEPWFNLIRETLRKVPKGSNVFVEIPYGLQPDKSIFRFIGGKVIQVEAMSQETERRVVSRGTPELLPFVEKIPGLSEARKIATANLLNLVAVENNGSEKTLSEKAKQFNAWLQKGEQKWKTYLPESYSAI